MAEGDEARIAELERELDESRDSQRFWHDTQRFWHERASLLAQDVARADRLAEAVEALEDYDGPHTCHENQVAETEACVFCDRWCRVNEALAAYRSPKKEGEQDEEV